MPKKPAPITLRQRAEFGVVISLIRMMHLLPYKARSATMGWILAYIVSPLAGYRKRARENLRHVWPEMDATSRNALAIKVTRHLGRVICEQFSPADLVRMAAETPLSGPGLTAMQEARTQGRPIIVISGHYGNYDIGRAALIAQGFDVGGLYRHMNNPLFHAYYLRTISAIGTPLFERGRPGLGAMLRHLKGGGTLAALIDVRVNNGVPMPFFGKPALTATSMAELALRYDALLVPLYATRLPSGTEFRAVLEAPIPHTDPETMTNALNTSLEAHVLETPEQWFWVHNRWKGVPHDISAN